MYPRRGLTAQLACVRHAASVHSEPGSNSPVENCDRHAKDATFSSIESSHLFELVVCRYPIRRPDSGLVSVARSEDQMTEVRWFLSIQFSKSLVPWRAYQSRTLQPRCQALSMKCFGVFVAVPSVVGSATIRKVLSAVKSPARIFLNPGCAHENLKKYQPIAIDELRRGKEGGRVPRQGRHVLERTLDRMEGASLRGPETLPPWNLVFKWSDTKWYHSLGSGSFSTLHSDHGTFAADPQSLMWRVLGYFQESFL